MVLSLWNLKVKLNGKEEKPLYNIFEAITPEEDVASKATE